jgi:hypothetical protein
MKLTSLILASLGAATLLLTTSAQAQTTLAAWTFENITPDASSSNPVAVNTPTPSSGTGSADAIGMNVYATPNVGQNLDDVLVGSTGDTGSNTLADLTNVWRVRGQASTNGAANGWSSLAPVGTQGAQFFTSTTPYGPGATGIQVSFDWYSTTQGEANLQLEYTTDGTTWINTPISIGSNSTKGLAVVTNSGSDANSVTGSYISDNKALNGSKAGQDWFQGLTATITDPNAINDPNFGIELVNASTGASDVSTQGTALNNSSGNWRFDNISIAAVPEPSSWLLGLCAGSLLTGFGLFRTKKSAQRA